MAGGKGLYRTGKGGLEYRLRHNLPQIRGNNLHTWPVQGEGPVTGISMPAAQGRDRTIPEQVYKKQSLSCSGLDLAGSSMSIWQLWGRVRQRSIHETVSLPQSYIYINFNTTWRYHQIPLVKGSVPQDHHPSSDTNLKSRLLPVLLTN